MAANIARLFDQLDVPNLPCQAICSIKSFD